MRLIFNPTISLKGKATKQREKLRKGRSKEKWKKKKKEEEREEIWI